MTIPQIVGILGVANDKVECASQEEAIEIAQQIAARNSPEKVFAKAEQMMLRALV